MNKKSVIMLLFTCCSLSAAAQFSKAKRDYVEYIITTDHKDRNYNTGEEAIIKIEAYKGGIPVDGVKVYYSTGDEMMPHKKTLPHSVTARQPSRWAHAASLVSARAISISPYTARQSKTLSKWHTVRKTSKA